MRKKLLIALALLVALAVALWLLFFRDDAPEAVSTEAGLEQLQQDLAASDEQDDAASRPDEDAAPEDAGSEDAGSEDAGTEVDDEPEPDEEQNPEPTVEQRPFVGAANGVWTVDDEFGDFDFDTASGSFAGFRVAEELTVGKVTAVGRTGGVAGSLTIEDGALVEAEITVDMTTIVSNDARREHAIVNALDSRNFPTALFTLTEPVPLDVETLESGSTLTADVVGDLTVKGTTNQVTFSLQATIAEAGIGLIIGSTEIIWQDFGVTPPRAPIVVSVEDRGIVEFQLIVRTS
ncbi:MAG: YceI family protein [Acidimicrobiaceae bacterium]|nr:YceI family protein [Acidimicrobiaceae bacterium]